MNQYNFPTTILCGQGALAEFVNRIQAKNHRHLLIVTDPSLVTYGLVDHLTRMLSEKDMAHTVFSDTHPNPVEEDVEKGAGIFRDQGCDAIIAFGGGSPMDAAKAIKIMAVHPFPMEPYDDAKGGDRNIVHPMPPLYAIPTTAGTGSEVGRSAVIILKSTGRKTIFFHPDLMPDMAVLEPELTTNLPEDITAATGMDAFIHCLEAYFSPGFHPMADGIALQGMELILDWLPQAVKKGRNLKARERMLIAASMGAVAFQKGLGMIHSMAHPLSSRHGLHHGLANALLLPQSIAFLEKADLDAAQMARMERVKAMFDKRIAKENSLSGQCRAFIKDLGIVRGLSHHGIGPADLEILSTEAFEDPCHANNMIPVTRSDLLSVYRAAL